MLFVWALPQSQNNFIKNKLLIMYSLGSFYHFFFEKAKLTHPIQHQRELNLRPRRGARSQLSSQYHQTNPNGLVVSTIIVNKGFEGAVMV